MRFHYFLLLCLPCCAQSQTIVPEGRAIDWRSAGLNNPATIPGNFVDIVALGADPDGNEPAESVVQYAINQLSEQGGGLAQQDASIPRRERGGGAEEVSGG